MAGTRPPAACCISSRRRPDDLSREVAARRGGKCLRLDLAPMRLAAERSEVVRRERHRIGRRIDQSRPMEWVRRSEEHTSELQSREKLVCRLLLEKKKKKALKEI